MKACSGLTLKAIYSRSLKSAKALNADVDLYSDDSGSGKTYHDLLLRGDIHAVIIALPILNQPEHIEAALAAGKHVLSEKPIAADIKRAEHLIRYSKSDKVRGGATWGVAENFRFLEAFEYGRQEVAKLGRILGFRVKMFGNVKSGGKYFGKCLLNLLASRGSLIRPRNPVAQGTRISRGVSPRWRRPFRCWYSSTAWRGCEAYSVDGVHNTPAKTSASR